MIELSDYFIYASAETGYFAKISDRALDAPNLIQVPSLPPDANHKWDGQAWIVLTSDEIEEIMEAAAEEEDFEPQQEIEIVDIEASTATIPNSVVFWGNETGDAAALASRDRLINSQIFLQENTLQIPYNLNLTNQKYLINGININPLKDNQKVIRTNQKNYSKTNWAHGVTSPPNLLPHLV